jgi:hypothetical protein
MGWAGARARRARGVGAQSGQALVIVIGMVTMIWLGTMVMVQNVTGHYPLIEQDVLQHEAYRAMQAGVNDYTSEANSDPDYVLCNAYIYSGTTYTSSSSNNMTLVGSPSTRNLSSGLCAGPSVGAWTSVPNLATTKGPPAWFLYGSPSIYNCTGGTSKCPAPIWVSMQVVGAAGSTNDMSYDTGTVTFDPQNGFLLNLWWLNYDQQDPASLGGNFTCTYYWANSYALKPGCAAVDFITGESLTGNIFSNDSIFISGTPTINGAVSTGDPSCYFENAGSAPPPCPSPSPSGTYTKALDQPFEQPPTDDAVLGAVAAQGGCLYEGPTELQLAQNGSSNTLYPTTQWGINVTTPDTPNRGNPGTKASNDADNDTSNSNPCVPDSSGGWVPYPSNGVVFVENCTAGNSICNDSTPYNPLSFYGTNNSQEFGTYGPTEGDAIVEGTVQGPLTIAAQNDVVIAGNICYQSWANCATAPSTETTADMLGLIAYNYVEVNHPVTCTNNNNGNCNQYSNDAKCPSNEAPMGPGTSLDCSLDPGNTGTYPNTGTTYIDAAILALNHQFWVNYFDQGNPMGNLEINGSISEDWRGPVGQFSNNDQITNGYSKQYDYDPRLEYISPPQYLTPGTSSWALGSLSSSKGFCPTGITGCSTIP